MAKLFISREVGRLTDALRIGYNTMKQRPGRSRIKYIQHDHFRQLAKKENVGPDYFNVYTRENWLV